MPKRIGILTGGGDTCALNGSIEAIRNSAVMLGYQVIGIKYGWKGLLSEGHLIDLTDQPIDGGRGGSILYSSRTNPFNVKTDNGTIDKSDIVAANIKKSNIELLVSIGGDDTNGAAKKLYEKYKIPVIGFPKTIDNDLRTKTIHRFNGKKIEAVLCPGFPTAAHIVSDLIGQLRTTVDTHKRIFVVEVMGRDAGWLAAAAAHGGADLILIPEIHMTKHRIGQFFTAVKEAYKKSINGGLIIAVSEGLRWYNSEADSCETVKASVDMDAYGHPRLGGISGKIASEITAQLDIDARCQILGYLPRSGQASAYDKQLTTILGNKVGEMILMKKFGEMPVLKEIDPLNQLNFNSVQTMPIEKIGNQPLPVRDYYNEFSFKIKEAYLDFLSILLGKPAEIPDLNIYKPLKK